MKRRNRLAAFISLAAVVALTCVMLASGVFAEDIDIAPKAPSYDIADTSPAIYVAEKNANSVVGVQTSVETWSRYSGARGSQVSSEGSGVVIAEGGYVLTNYHVIAGGDSYQVLMPDGEKVDASLIGYDSSYDIAVLRVAERADALMPAAIGSVGVMKVGSTVVAIGNPGGETLSNTVTQGVISCLERAIDGGNTSRTVSYIQHDAAINSGNSGGGLFDVNGNLIGINTLKYGNQSMYFMGGATYEGLGFAIPIDTVIDVAYDLIKYGAVQRAGLGVMIYEVDGADEPSDAQTPAGLYVGSLVEGGPAERAGMLPGDYIIGIAGERVKTHEALTDVLDTYSSGDTVTVTVARYSKVSGYPRGWPGRSTQEKYECDVLDIDVKLEILN